MSREICGARAALAELDADEADEPPERLFDDRRLRVAQDHVALALVAARGGLPGSRHLRLHDERTELLLRAVEAVDLDDAPPALPPQIGDPGREAPLGRVERLV